MHGFKRRLITILIGTLIFVVSACSNTTAERHFDYSFASREKGLELLMGNKEYHAGFSQCELDYKTQKVDATIDEYLAHAREQVLDFSENEKAAINEQMNMVESTLAEKGYTLPKIGEIVFVKTTQMEESGGSAAYTHGNEIYFGQSLINLMLSENENEVSYATLTLWHEIFHCLTRNNPEFREKMYNVINFTVQEKEFEIPPSVKEKFISNPDVERHDSYASFIIDGKPTDCFCALIATQPFKNEGDSFFNCMTTALVPIDGSDIYYTPEDAENFDEVFGKNTNYVIDPEECMADNFSFAMYYGTDVEYSSPEIIDAVIDIVSK